MGFSIRISAYLGSHNLVDNYLIPRMSTKGLCCDISHYYKSGILSRIADLKPKTLSSCLFNMTTPIFEKYLHRSQGVTTGPSIYNEFTRGIAQAKLTLFLSIVNMGRRVRVSGTCRNRPKRKMAMEITVEGTLFGLGTIRKQCHARRMSHQNATRPRV